MYVKRKAEALQRNHSCSGKAISVTYSECASIAFFIQHAMGMSHVILSSVAYLDLPAFSTLTHKRHDFRNKVAEHEICVWIFHYNFETFLILRRIQRDIFINAYKSPCSVPGIFVIF